MKKETKKTENRYSLEGTMPCDST